jgi:ATP-binding cassette subfamily B protein IrtA
MNTLKRFKIYMGKRKILLPISLVLSAFNGLLALVPALFSLAYRSHAYQ